MRKRLSLLFLAITASSSATLRAEFTAVAGWDQQLFPSYIIATAAIKNSNESQPETTLGECNGLLGVQVEAPCDNSKIEVTIECDRYIEKSTFSGTLSREGETYSVFPKIRYKFDRLSQCDQATPATVTFRVRIGDQEQEEKSTTVTFRPVNDCPLAVVKGDQIIDTSFTFATFVNEQHPYTDKLLREALDIGVVDNFTGYQSGSDQEVLRQVYAIWDLFVARDVRYSSITTTAVGSDEVFSQNVRLLEDTINNQQANCVDGSALVVSMLRKIGIESFLVLIPGHCYVGFYVDKEQTRVIGLETTLVGTEVEWPEEVDELLDEAIDESLKSEFSWPSFVAAVEVGSENLMSNTEKFKDPSQHEFEIIDIAAARKAGVLPIPFQSKSQFVSFDHSSYISTNSTEEDSEEDSEDSEDWNDEDEDEDEDE